jgi:N-acetylmuramoyl-L-alanine amidase
MKILLDNGHGQDTPGKRSPDGFFREYAYTRFLASQIQEQLVALGLDAQLLVPELEDISLPERCHRVNAICQEFGKDQVILLSLHVNAAGNGHEWMNARGWSCYTTRGETTADGLATALYDAAKDWLPGMRIRTDYTDGDPDIEKDFYLLRHTQCPAVLTENLFMDNKEDVAFLESGEGVAAIIQLHLDGILQYTFQ